MKIYEVFLHVSTISGDVMVNYLLGLQRGLPILEFV